LFLLLFPLHFARVQCRRVSLRAGCVPPFFLPLQKLWLCLSPLKTTSGTMMMTETLPTARVPPDSVAARDRPEMATTGAAAAVAVAVVVIVVVPWRPSPASHATTSTRHRLPHRSSSPTCHYDGSLHYDSRSATGPALCQRTRVKFSRRPDRSCSVGAAKLVSHVCASACLAVRRRVGSGLSNARMKLFAIAFRTPNVRKVSIVKVGPSLLSFVVRLPSCALI
jgi:hypothetical protein